MTSENNKRIAKRGKTKNLRGAKRTLATLQGIDPKGVWECLLYVRGTRSNLNKLADRASLAKGITWGISEIRPPSITSPVLSLQHSFRRERSKVLFQNVSRGRRGLHEATRARQKGNNKSPRPLHKPNRKLSRAVKRWVLGN